MIQTLEADSQARQREAEFKKAFALDADYATRPVHVTRIDFPRANAYNIGLVEPSCTDGNRPRSRLIELVAGLTSARVSCPLPPSMPILIADTHSRGSECCYRWNRPSPNLCKSCLLTFAGKLDFGCAGAISAIEVPTLAFTGVARKAWMSPA